jgi:ABC-type multidrug transport system ATPase subunit
MATGAGKTTLMDVIAGRKTVGTIHGNIYANGRPVEQRTWSRCMGYVEQSDVHSHGQTVEEALWTSARLRLPTSVGDREVGMAQQ